MIKSGTENIYPAEVEQAIATLEGVVEVAAIGVPDEAWGETVAAFVVQAPGANLDAEAVIAHCRAQIASYKKPRHVIFIDSLPRNTANKNVLRAHSPRSATRRLRRVPESRLLGFAVPALASSPKGFDREMPREKQRRHRSQCVGCSAGARRGAAAGFPAVQAETAARRSSPSAAAAVGSTHLPQRRSRSANRCFEQRRVPERVEGGQPRRRSRARSTSSVRMPRLGRNGRSCRSRGRAAFPDLVVQQVNGTVQHHVGRTEDAQARIGQPDRCCEKRWHRGPPCSSAGRRMVDIGRFRVPDAAGISCIHSR
jgi:hypothetical protein